ncbi:hypothetical protein PanWU01x14_208340, partial [Parasponia andersonii]
SLIDESIWAPGRNSKVHFWSNNWLGSPLIGIIDCNDSLELGIDTTIDAYNSLVDPSVKKRWGNKGRIRLDGSVIDLWLDALETNFSSQVSQLWRSAIVTAVWVIWTSRNKLLFDNELTSIHMAITLVWCVVGESINIGS